MSITQNLEKLSLLTSVAGFEKQAAQSLLNIFKDLCDEVYIDRFYNVICVKNGSHKAAKKIMLTAHMDEIGLIVSSVDDNGYIGISNIGGVDAKVLLAQEVIVHGKKDIYGVIGATPPHLLKPEDRDKTIKLDGLRVDTGIGGGKLKELVSIGDLITIKAPFTSLAGGKVCCKALDNRAGVSCLIEVLKLMQNVKHENTIICVASTQEETYLTGVITASHALLPDAAFVIDVSHGEIPDAPRDNTSVLGKGPEIAIGPNLQPQMVRKCFDLAKEAMIPFQKMVESGDTGTEAWATQVSCLGIPTVLLSIPLRYMHTQVEVIATADVKYTARIAAEFLKLSQQEVSEVLTLY